MQEMLAQCKALLFRLKCFEKVKGAWYAPYAISDRT
jgi:hypothetical protein